MTRPATTPLLLEVCTGSVEDCLAAQAGGADRLELNSALDLGGLTPSPAVLEMVRPLVDIPIIAMVRPRPGGFCYSDHDFVVMLREVDLLLDHGADGVAFGILLADGRVDRRRCRLFVERVAGRGEVVFHRAFDVTPEPLTALDTLMELGVQRLLTSGQAVTALDGAEAIAAYVRHCGTDLEILPGAGIRPDNVQALLARSGCRQVHASLRTVQADDSTTARPQIRFESGWTLPPGHFKATDVESVRAVRAQLDGSG